MRYSVENTQKSFAASVPTEDFIALTRFEGGGAFRNFTPDCVSLCTYLEKLPHISRVEYNGHFGSYIYFNMDVDEDQVDEKHCLAFVDKTIGNFLDDARRLTKYFPNIAADGSADRDQQYEFLYTDDDFVILGTGKEDEVYLGSPSGTVLISGKNDVEEVLDIVLSDIEKRSFIEGDKDAEEQDYWLPKTPSRGLVSVRAWASKYIELPDENLLKTVPMDGHELSTFIPKNGRAVFVSPDFVFCDHEKGDLSLSFHYEDGTGATYFTDGARDQMVEFIKKAQNDSEARSNFISYLTGRYNPKPNISRYGM